MIKASKSRIISLILVAALVIGMVPMTAFAFKANPTPSKPQVPIGATSVAVGSVTIEETTTTDEFPVADTSVTVTLLDDAGAATIHFANVPTVSGSNAHGITLVNDKTLRIAINGTTGTDDFITISNINYKVDSGANLGNVKVTVAVAGVGTKVFNNATVVNGVYAGREGTKTSLSASGTNIAVANIGTTETAVGQFQSGKTLSLTIANSGVIFSQTPTTTVTPAGLELSSGTLSGDKKTATWTINTASTAATAIKFGAIKLDIASSTAAGDITINIATSGSTPINPTSVAVANLTVSGTISASATSASVTTGNGKAAGNITLTESQAQSFSTASPLVVTLGNGATFQSAPTATGSGGITFVAGSSSATATAGTLGVDFKTASWTLNSQSTSTGGITVSGIMLNIPAGTSGDITATITGAGLSSTNTKTVTIASVATTGIASVSTASQAVLEVNKPNQAASDVTIVEGAAGSLASGSVIYLQIFGQTSLTNKTITFGSLPTVQVTSGDLTLGTPTLDTDSVTLKIPVTTKSTSLSTVKVSGIKYDVANAAAEGDISLDARYSASGAAFTSATRLDTVSNAIIGTLEQIFPDVPATHFAFNAVEFLASAGIIGGRTNGNFDPNASITRGEFAKIICLAAGLITPGTGGSASFSDTSGHWAAGYIEAAKTADFIGGYPDGTFRPNNLITRAEIAKLVVLGAGFATTSGAGFSDIATNWAKDFIMTASNNGIVNGYSDGTFRPNNSATRAEASVMVYNWLANK